MKQKFALIEDHASVAEAVTFAIEAALPFTCVGSYQNLDDARRLLPAAAPRLVIVDWRVGGTIGPEVIESVFPLLPVTHWLLYTATTDAFILRRAMFLGVKSAVSKASPLSDLIKGAQETADGRSFFCECSSSAIRAIFAGRGEKLNDTELKIVQHIAAGKDAKEVADSVGVAPKTVHNCLASIRQKLGRGSMVSIANWAVEHGVAPAA